MKLGVPDTRGLETRRSTETVPPPLGSLYSHDMSGSFCNAHLEIEPDENAVRFQVTASAQYASLSVSTVSMDGAECNLTKSWSMSIKRAI